MTPCDDIQPRLTAYLDHELTDIDRQMIDDHLRGCINCAAFVDSYRTIKAAVVVDPADENMWDAVAARIDETDTMTALLTELRMMRDEMQALRVEVADLRRELARRPAPPSPRTSPLSFPDAPERSLKQYRLV